MERFNVLVVRPPMFLHHEAYGGTADVIRSGLQRLGYETGMATNQLDRKATNIIVGAHYLDHAVLDELPPETIIYNTEMVVRGSPFIKDLIPFVQRFETWDYSLANVEGWRAQGVSRPVRWLRPGYLPESTTIDPSTPADIDILFYGFVNGRRYDILKAMIDSGLNVYIAKNAYGEERSALIARCKIVLNLHSRPDSMLEFARVSQALSNHRVLVTEVGNYDEIDADLREGMAAGTAEELPEICRALLADDARRAALAERGFELFSRRDFSVSLREVLAERDGVRAR